jgi:transposase-like protein
MIKETHECRECGSSNIVKNGHSASGSQQYDRKDCGAHMVRDPEPWGYSEIKAHFLCKSALREVRLGSHHWLSFW